MELTESLKSILIDTAKQLKGSARRIFMARIVKELGPGGASRAERELGWNRKTIRKGTHEVESGIVCVDAFGARGRKLAEEHLPHLLSDIRALVDGQSQAAIPNQSSLHAFDRQGSAPTTDRHVRLPR